MDTIQRSSVAASVTALAAVTGARHVRMARNGQDAAAVWGHASAGAVVVCDGCSAGVSSEVGARLGSRFVIAAIARALEAGERPDAIWRGVREQVVAAIGSVVEAMPGDRVQAVHDHFLFTVVAAAWRGEEVAVWALGDGAFALGDRVEVLGPFADNQPPYLAYDLLGMPQSARLIVGDARCRSVAVATDGIAELGLESFVRPTAIDRYLTNPDSLRRELAIRARGEDHIDWEARRVERFAASLQDDGAIALARWR